MAVPDVTDKMRSDWDRRAREDANYYAAFGRRGQEEAEFQSTAVDVVRDLDRELRRLGRHTDRTALRALEIGCGPGRIMLPMSARFGEIHGVDISAEMVRLARERLRQTPNAHPQVNNGADLGAFADESFDFVYSYAVFQHIPSREVVFDYLAHERNYKENVRRIEEISTSYHLNHDSEEMAFLAMFTLMRLETDPALWTLWREGLEGLFQARRKERDPELNMIYAALARADEYDLEQSMETLQRLPLDMVQWGVDLSHRWDRDEDPKLDRQDKKQNTFVFPYDERMPERWSENPFAYAQGGDGHAESSGTFWLLPYWMARYYGLIR